VTLNIVGDGVWTPSISISDPGHAHPYIYPSNTVASSGAATTSGQVVANPAGITSSSVTGITATSTAAPSHTHAGSTASFSGSVAVTVSNNTGTTETRPINVTALCCIRY
jgi:hypothetical protein